MHSDCWRHNRSEALSSAAEMMSEMNCEQCCAAATNAFAS